MRNENLINSYFEGTLTPQDRLLFDKLMETDPSFSEQVTFHEMIKAAIALETRDSLKSKLQEFEDEQISKSRGKKWLYVAASIAVLLGISLFFVDQKPTANKLYAQYFEPYPNTVAPVVRSDSDKNLKSDAFAAYESENYEKASQLFVRIASTEKEEFAYFYNAMSLMKLERVSEAADILSKTEWTESYKDKSLWYLSLCRLKQNNLLETKELLRKLIQKNGFKYKEAESLLRELK